MREIVHIQAGQCGNQIGAKVSAGYKCFKFKFELLLDFVDNQFFSSFGKLFRMNMELIQLEHIMEILIYNLSASTFIIMKQPVSWVIEIDFTVVVRLS